jgi:uncharacterized membrane protein
MRKIIITSLVSGIALFSFVIHGFAAPLPELPADEYSVGRVLEVTQGREEEMLNLTQQFLNLRILLTSGSEQGSEVTIEDADRFSGSDQEIQPGDKIIVVKTWDTPTGFTYRVDDRYRLPAIGWIFGLFLALVIFFGRRKGLGSILGLTASILILFYYVAPQLIGGADPIWVTLIGAFLIAICSILLGHGFHKRTYVALLSTLITLAVSVLLADLFVRGSYLFGMGTEEAFYLQAGGAAAFDLQGLLLGGIIIGMLGILDDVTTAQSATVEEIRRANNQLHFRELYQRGLSVGKEHIASLVNTLVLAYVGASLPLFLLFTLNSQHIPRWVLLNGEFMAEEIIRALAGSVALVLAVPISTSLAAYFFSLPRE